jgi:hypothetical protein
MSSSFCCLGLYHTRQLHRHRQDSYAKLVAKNISNPGSCQLIDVMSIVSTQLSRFFSVILGASCDIRAKSMNSLCKLHIGGDIMTKRTHARILDKRLYFPFSPHEKDCLFLTRFYNWTVRVY